MMTCSSDRPSNHRAHRPASPCYFLSISLQSGKWGRLPSPALKRAAAKPARPLPRKSTRTFRYEEANRSILLEVHPKGFLNHEIHVRNRRMKSPRALDVNVKQMAGKAELLSSLWPQPLLSQISIFGGGGDGGVSAASSGSAAQDG